MLNQALQVLLLQCVHHIEEVLSAWNPTFGQLVWEMHHKLLVILAVRPEVSH